MHSARHTFATELRRVAGVEAASQALGHSDLSTTLGIYGHQDQRDLERAMDAFAQVREAEEAKPGERFDLPARLNRAICRSDGGGGFEARELPRSQPIFRVAVGPRCDRDHDPFSSSASSRRALHCSASAKRDSISPTHVCSEIASTPVASS